MVSMQEPVRARNSRLAEAFFTGKMRSARKFGCGDFVAAFQFDALQTQKAT